MSINFDFTKQINGSVVAFHGTANDPGEALTTIAALMADVATAVANKTAAKNSTAAATANPSTDAKTPTASDSSANSSNVTPVETATDTKPADDTNVVTLEYDKHVKPLVLAIAKKSKAFAEALLQRHGAVDPKTNMPSAKVLEPKQYPAFVKDAQAVVDGTLDPTASADGDGAIA